MKLKRATITLVSASFVVMAGLAVLPNTAFASSPRSLWVNAAGTVAPSATTGTSCASPGFTTIQAAIDVAPANANVHICSGTYAEQLQITSPLSLVSAGSSVTIELPATPVTATTTCDLSPGSDLVQPNQDEISICTAGTVGIKGITVEALWPTGLCYDSLYGIYVAGGADLKMTDSEMDGAGAFPLNGCQGGVGIQVGRAKTAEVGLATLNNVKVFNYQKNGVTVDGPGSSAKIVGSMVTGAGPAAIGQNGIQISRGAKGTIKTTTVTGNECNIDGVCGSDGLLDTQSTGVLFYGAATGSTVSHSSLNNNDVGIYAGSVTPNASTVSITDVSFSADRWEGLQIDGDTATVSHDTVSGGNVGLQLLQYAGQPFASKVTGKSDTFTGLTVAAAQVYSDQSAGDLAGFLTLSKSKVSGNPGSITGSVLDNSISPSAFIVTLKKDT
jgi:hypothetical protein